MKLISPLCSIRPDNNLRYYIYDNLIHHGNNINKPITSINDRTVYVKNSFYQNLLYKDDTEHYYCCKITAQSSSHIGLIAKVDLRFIEKNIFRHEQYIENKKEQYTDCFNIHKVQINPVIFMHDHNPEIEKYLIHLALNNKPSIRIEAIDILYEIWIIDNIQATTTLYNSLKKLIIADGHHRVASILNTKNYFFSSAFLISKNQINSKNIFRIYKGLAQCKKISCLNYLQKHFEMQEMGNIFAVENITHFKVCFDKKWYRLKNSNIDKCKDRLLDFLNKNINYCNNGEIGFTNYPINNEAFTSDISESDFAIIIPAHQFKGINKSQCYPPHSTWLEPKLPDGLISFAL